MLAVVASFKNPIEYLDFHKNFVCFGTIFVKILTIKNVLERLSSPTFSPGSRVERSWIFRMTSSPMLRLLSSPPFSPGSRVESSGSSG
jgi:hypothetical protein